MAYDQKSLDDYVDVAERIRIFRDRFPEGTLQPLDPAEPFRILEVGEQTFVVYTAVAYRSPNDTLPGIAVSWEPFPGRTPYTAGSELMNAETAAWGRAIVAALAADSKKIASLDEVRARRETQNNPHPSTQPRQTRPERPQSDEPATNEPMATDAQERALYAISKKLDRLPPAKGTLTKRQAGQAIEKLQELMNAKAADQEEPF
jgi:hypothetical protein